jgi:hypothetical protein
VVVAKLDPIDIGNPKDVGLHVPSTHDKAALQSFASLMLVPPKGKLVFSGENLMIPFSSRRSSGKPRNTTFAHLWHTRAIAKSFERGGNAM